MNEEVGISIIARDMASAAFSRVRGEMAGLGVAARESNVASGLLSGGLGVARSAAGYAETAFGTLRMRVGQLASGIGILGGGAGLLGLGAILTGSISKSRDFAQAMELVHTQAGASQAEVEHMTAALTAMAGQVGTGPTELAAGLYHVESAGIRGAKALDVLRAAAEGARVGNADLESVTNALIATVNSGIGGVGSMTQAMGVLNSVVGAGNMRMQDLTDAMSTGILASAKTFGVSIQSVGAAIADMTNQGVPAIDAATRLRMTLSLLAAPTSKATTEFKSIGLTQLQLADDMRSPGGILAAVADLKDHLDKSGLAADQQALLISKAFGGGRSSSAIMTLLGSLDKFRTIQDQVNKGAGAFGEAWDATTHTAAYKIENFGAIAESVMIKIGNKILPGVADALGGLGNWFDEHGDDVANFFGAGVQVARDLVGIIGGVVGAFNSLPGWLKDVLIRGGEIFAADRVFKFVLGFDPLALGAKIAAGMLGPLVGGLFGKIGNLFGGVVNKEVPQSIGPYVGEPIPVFVTNMMPGGMGGGGPAAAAEGDAAAAAEGAGAFSAGGLAAIVAGIAAPLIMFDLIPKLFPGKAAPKGSLGDPTATVLPGAGGGSQPGIVTPGFGAQFTGMMPSAPTFIPKGTAGDPIHVTAPGLTPVGAGAANLAHGYGQVTGPGAAGLVQTQPLTASQFESILRTTPFMGPAGYKSIFENQTTEQFKRRDPTGEQFLALVERLANPKAPAVMGEIAGHLKELQSLEAYYIAHGDTVNAAKVEGVIDTIDRLIGVANAHHGEAAAAQNRLQAAVTSSGALTKRGMDANADATRSAEHQLAALNAKKWINNLKVNVQVANQVNLSTQQVVYKVNQYQQSVSPGNWNAGLS